MVFGLMNLLSGWPFINCKKAKVRDYPHERLPPAWDELACVLGMVRGLVVGLPGSGSLLHWDRARVLAKRSVEQKNEMNVATAMRPLHQRLVRRKARAQR